MSLTQYTLLSSRCIQNLNTSWQSIPWKKTSVVSATHSFSHAKILNGPGNVVRCIMLYSTSWVALVTLWCYWPISFVSCLLHYQHAFLQFRTLTSQTFVVPVIPMMVFGSNDLGGEFSQSDSLLSHALVGIPGITGAPWITRMLNNILIECS